MKIRLLKIFAAVAVLLFPHVKPVFLASIYLNVFIVFVFLVGILACFWQVASLISSVSWIEGFALDVPGADFARPPRLLAPLAAMLSERRARRALPLSWVDLLLCTPPPAAPHPRRRRTRSPVARPGGGPLSEPESGDRRRGAAPPRPPPRRPRPAP